MSVVNSVTPEAAAKHEVLFNRPPCGVCEQGYVISTIRVGSQTCPLILDQAGMEQRTLKNVNNCLNTNIYSYLDTSGGQHSNLCKYVVHFSTPVLIRHLWQLKTVVFLH